MTTYSNPGPAMGVPAAGFAATAVPAIMQPAPLLRVFRHRRRTVLLSMLLCVAAASIYVVQTPPLYSSSSRVFISCLCTPPASTPIGYSDAFPFLCYQAQQMKSVPVLSAALAELNPVSLKTFVRTDNPVLYLQNNLNIDVDRTSDVLTISMNSRVRQDPAPIVNAVVRAYISQTYNHAFQNQLSATGRELADATAELQAAESMIRNHNNVAQFIEYLRQKGIDFADADYLNMQAELERDEMRLAALTVSAGSNNPAIAEMQTRIDLLQQKMTSKYLAAAEVYLTNLQLKVDAIKARRRREIAAMDMMQATASRPQAGGAWNLTSNAMDHRKMDQMGEMAHIDAPTIVVLNAAQPSIEPLQLPEFIVMGCALLSGLVLGSLLGLVQEWKEHHLRTPQEAARLLRLPIISVVPHMPAWQTNRARARTMQFHSNTDSAEAYRTIRTALGTNLRHDSQTLLVTSPVAGDGKSVTAANLAIAFAQAGQKTLLLDCDLRKPAQHKIFDLPTDGLTSVVSRQAKLSIAVQITDVENLSILPAGPAIDNPSELLGSKRFRRIMSVLMKVYDKIIIDAPSIIKLSDARVLATSANATLMVLRAGKSTDWQACAAVEGLRNIGAQVLGIIMNDLRRDEHTLGYFAGYSYYGDSVTDRRQKATTRDWQQTWKHTPQHLKMAG